MPDTVNMESDASDADSSPSSQTANELIDPNDPKSNPWPHISSFYEHRGSKGKNHEFVCLLCKPKKVPSPCTYLISLQPQISCQTTPSVPKQGV